VRPPQQEEGAQPPQDGNQFISNDLGKASTPENQAVRPDLPDFDESQGVGGDEEVPL
jgi:hypothetical protein